MKRLPDARLERVLASLALVIISLISLTNVVTRYVTGGSLAFTEEFSVILMVVVTFAGTLGRHAGAPDPADAGSPAREARG